MKGLLAVFVAVALFSGVYVNASEESSLGLLKRLLEAVKEINLEDRSAQLIMYNKDKGEVRVFLQVCVRGDRSKVLCRKPDGHFVQVIRASDGKVMKEVKIPKYFVMSKEGLPVPPDVEAISVSHMPPGEYYVKSCEYTNGGGNANAQNSLNPKGVEIDHCNKKPFTIEPKK